MSNQDGKCIQCKQPAIPRCHSEAGRREFAISGMCEICFDAMFAEDEEDDPIANAEVHTLTELQYAEIGEGPWKMYVYNNQGFHSGGMWFRKRKPKYPDEEITLTEAKKRSDANIAQRLEVKVCDGGDMLVFHSQCGVVLYGDGFWEAVTK